MENEDGMVPKPSTSTSTSLMTSENASGPPNDYHHNDDSNMSYPSPPSNPDNLRPDSSAGGEYEENVGCTFASAGDEMLFDINEDLDVEETTVVSDDEVRVEAPRSGMEFGSEKEVMDYYKKYAKQEGFGVRTQRTKRDDDGRSVYVTIGCARGGKYVPKNINMSKPRATTKTDCKAKLLNRQKLYRVIRCIIPPRPD